jgi:antitoxin MazE
VDNISARIQKWGNSLALRIPKVYAQKIGLEQDSPVQISVEGSRLIIEPKPRFTLDELLAEVTPENIHEEIDFGPAVGKEVW